MVTLQNEFVSNNDKMSDNKFTLVRRQEVPNQNTNNGVAIYRRERMNGNLVGFEVFIVKVIKAGTRLPDKVVDGETVAQSNTEDYEQYPGSAAFGRTASFCVNMTQAEERLKFYVNKLTGNEPVEAVEIKKVAQDKTVKKVASKGGKRGRPAGPKRTVNYPNAKSMVFTFKDLQALNPVISYPLLYVEVQKDIKAGKLNVVGKVKTEGKRGKPQVQYQLK